VRNGGGTESRSPSIGCGIAVDAMPDEYVLELSCKLPFDLSAAMIPGLETDLTEI